MRNQEHLVEAAYRYLDGLCGLRLRGERGQWKTHQDGNEHETYIHPYMVQRRITGGISLLVSFLVTKGI
jgi:hypothetical protein